MPHDAQKPIEFIIPGVYLGERLSDAEATEAAFDFGLLSAEQFVKHADTLVSRTANGRKATVLTLGISGQDGTSLDIEVFNVLEPGNMLRQVALVVMDADRKTISQFIYSLTQEGDRVTRWDTPDVQALFGGVDMKGHALVHDDDTQTKLEDIYATDQFEAEMGLNDQPVGLAEIQQLRELLEKATPRQVL